MAHEKQNVLILGSTGSVGTSTLDVLARHPDSFNVIALTASSNVSLMVEQCQNFRPECVVMNEAKAADELRHKLNALGLSSIQVESGAQSIVAASEDAGVDIVMSAIVGAAGLLPTLRAVQCGKRVLIANKEPLVMTGSLFIDEAKKAGATILPIDSEHNAIFQCMPHDQSKQGIKKIHLTGSGGPFLGRSWHDLHDITPDEACAHPNWSMGRKISVDSATMMNKGLEFIEAVGLFGVPVSQIEVLIHPQSVIHSMVEYVDGSFLAQLGAPDMRTPIAHALSWPERIESGVKSLDLAEIAKLDFLSPNLKNMPCLKLSFDAASTGRSAPAILNAANEIAVSAFLEKKIRFTSIPKVIDTTLQTLEISDVADIDHVLQIDKQAREVALKAVTSIGF